MKRIAIYILLIFMFGNLMPSHLNAQANDDFELIKGNIVDEDNDGKWDYLYFEVITRNAKIEVPVKAVSIDTKKPNGQFYVAFSNVEVNKKINEYVVDLRELKLSGNFTLSVVIDISATLSVSELNQVTSGPGTNPNETILILEYP